MGILSPTKRHTEVADRLKTVAILDNELSLNCQVVHGWKEELLSVIYDRSNNEDFIFL